MYNTIIICPAGDYAMKICPYCVALICPYNNRKHRCKKCKSKKHISFETRYVDIPYKPGDFFTIESFEIVSGNCFNTLFRNYYVFLTKNILLFNK